MTELAVPDREVLEGVVADPPRPTLAEGAAAALKTFKAVSAAFAGLAETMRASLAPFRKMFHLISHEQPAKCRICNPRGNPPPVPWAVGYRRKTRNRNARRK